MENKSAVRDSNKLLLFCWIAYAVVYIGRKNYSACMSDMVSDGIIDKVFGGTVGTGFLSFYAVGQFINGMLGDKISPKYMVSCGLFFAGFMNILMGINSYPFMFLIFWCLNGYFCSMMWSPIIKSVSEWCDDSMRESAGAAMSASIPAGSILSYLVCAVTLKFFSWRIAFTVCGIILICVSFVFFLGITSLKSHIGYMEEKRKSFVYDSNSQSSENKYNLIFILFSVGVIFAVIGVMFNGILKDGLDLWVPTYITDVFISDSSLAAVLVTILPIVNLAGVYAAKWLKSRFFPNEFATCAVLFGVSAVSFIPLIFITKSALASGNAGVFTAVISVILISVSTASMLGINTMLLTFIPFHFSRIGRSSTVTGFLNSCSYAAAAVSGIVIGSIAGNYSWTVTVSAFFVVSLAGCIACIVGIKPWKNGRLKVPHN